MSKIKVALDAGHGGNNSTAGKRTPDGEYEWTFNNKVAKYCDERLKQYGKFETIRVDDVTGKTDISLQSRVSKANSWKANLYISIHQNANAGKWGSHGGTETFYHASNSNAKKLADLIQKEMVKEVGLRNRGIKNGNHLYVIRSTNMTSILTEGAFMDSTTDIIALRDESKLKKQGYAIADGIAKYYGFKLNNYPTNTIEHHKGDDELRFTSPTLKSQLETRLDSKASKDMIIESTIKELGYSDSWKTKQTEDGDIISMAFELAIKLIKEKESKSK